MFTLRRVIKENNIESNMSLGKSYAFIHHELSPEVFKAELNKHEDIKSYAENVYAFVISDDGSIVQPLLKSEWNYIMTETGKTFSNVSYK